MKKFKNKASGEIIKGIFYDLAQSPKQKGVVVHPHRGHSVIDENQSMLMLTVGCFIQHTEAGYYTPIAAEKMSSDFDEVTV